MVVLQPIKPGPPRVNLSLKRGRARRALSLLGNNNTRQNLHLAESLLTISAEEFTNKWNFDPIQGVPLPSGRFQWTPFTSVTSSDPTTGTSSAVDPIKAVGTTPSCDLSSSSPADLQNPAENKSEEQTTCVTLPPPPPPSVPGPTKASSCQVISESQQGDVSKNQKKSSEPETAKAENGTHDCCPRTCACTCPASGIKGSSDKMSHSRAKDSLKKISTKAVRIEADSGIDSDDSVVEDAESTPSSKTDSLQSAKLRQTCITEFVRPQKLSTFTPPEPPLHHTSPSSFSKKRPAPSSLQDQLNQPPHKKVLLHLRA